MLSQRHRAMPPASNNSSIVSNEGYFEATVMRLNEVNIVVAAIPIVVINIGH